MKYLKKTWCVPTLERIFVLHLDLVLGNAVIKRSQVVTWKVLPIIDAAVVAQEILLHA